MNPPSGEAQCRRFQDFTRDELAWIIDALIEVLHGPEAIKEWEFHTRMGATRDEVAALLRKGSAAPDW